MKRLVPLLLIVIPTLLPASPRVHKVRAVVTAYSSSPRHMTASGAHPHDGVVACPRRYPFGTKVLIYDRSYECLDRLGRKHDNNHFDIWMPAKAAAKKFGKRRILVSVVEP